MVSPAISIALLAGIESLLSAVVADGMTGRRHRSNMELVAQGVANIASPLFGGIPATGAIARTATNIKNGALTPVAGIIHAIVLLLIMMFFGKWAALIPMATLAGILLVVSYNMSEWHLFVKMFKSPKSDIAVLIVTFLLTVLVDLTVAIQAGVVLASILFMKRMADVTQVGYITSMMEDEEDTSDQDPNAIKRFTVPKGVEVFEVNGPFFFGAADRFKHVLSLIVQKAEGAHPPHAHRPVHGRHGAARARGSVRADPAGRSRAASCRRSCPAAHRDRPRRPAGQGRRGQRVRERERCAQESQGRWSGLRSRRQQESHDPGSCLGAAGRETIVRRTVRSVQGCPSARIVILAGELLELCSENMHGMSCRLHKIRINASMQKQQDPDFSLTVRSHCSKFQTLSL